MCMLDMKMSKETLKNLIELVADEDIEKKEIQK